MCVWVGVVRKGLAAGRGEGGRHHRAGRRDAGKRERSRTDCVEYLRTE